MTSETPRLGVRAMATTWFTASALAVSVTLALGTYLTARHFLLEQRQSTAARQAFVDAAFVRDGLATTGSEVSDVLDSTSPPPGAVVIVRRDDRWYSSSLDEGGDSVPPGVREIVRTGTAATSWAGLADGTPVIAVGVPVPAVDAEFYELSPTQELDSTLMTLGVVLGLFAVVTSAGAAFLGRTASARLMAPLDSVATAAAEIAAGRLKTRLPPTTDPDLAVIVGSFNTMVEALDERIERDARFASDVAHELRSPVTTLMTSVSLLRTSEGSSTPRRRAAVDMVEREVHRLHRALEHLLELGRLDARRSTPPTEDVDLVDLLGHSLEESHRPRDLLAGCDPTVEVAADKQVLDRAFRNLFDNADLHGEGLRAVVVRRSGTHAEVRVVDAGPGVGTGDRERIFDRFVRVGSRGSRPGTGLGLSLVAESVHASGGSVWCERTPGGGATFVIRLPLSRHTVEEEP